MPKSASRSRIDAVVISTQHDEDVTNEKLRAEILKSM